MKFWLLAKKSEKKILWQRIAVAAIIVLIIIIVAYAVSKIRFMINDELNLKLNPLQENIFLKNNESAVLNFSLRNENFPHCVSLCQLNMTDTYEESLISTEIIEMKHNQEATKQFTLSAPGRGKGQKQYSLVIKCSNAKSALCLTDGQARYRHAAILLNYELTNEEEKAIKAIQPKADATMRKLKECQRLLEQNKDLMSLAPNSVKETAELTDQIISHDKLFNVLQEASDELLKQWRAEEYISMKGTISDFWITNTESLAAGMNKTQGSIIELLKERNDNLIMLQAVSDNKKKIFEAFKTYASEKNPNNNIRIRNLEKASMDLNQAYEGLIGEIPSFERNTKNLIESGSARLKIELQSFDHIEAEKAFLEALGKTLLEMKGRENNFSLGSGCKTLSMMANRMQEENQNASLFRSSRYNWSIGNSTFDEEITLSSALMAGQAIEDALNKIKSQNIENKELVFTIGEGYHTGIKIGGSLNLTEEELMRLRTINTSWFTSFISANCRREEFEEKQDSFEIEKLLEKDLTALKSIQITIPDIATAPQQDQVLTENPRLCCGARTCASCCNESCSSDRTLFPVIIIHGHSVNQKNPPDYNLNAFSSLQESLQAEGFLSMGQLDLANKGEENDYGIWGQVKEPISIKASYYYVTHYELGSYAVTIRNDEGIKDYAMRLNDIIALVKYKTGREKVNIIAHSMGGLVAREYIGLFGSGSVDKTILVATPNHGIIGKIKDLCSVLGANKECDDLKEGSAFLSELNSRGIPEGSNIHSIRAVGCTMDDGKQGDGVVTDDSAYLAGAKNYLVRGNCSGIIGTDLHHDILQPEKYPEAFSIILNILRE